MGRSHLDNVLPDDYTLATISKVSGELEDLVFGKLIHGKSIRIGFMSDIVVATSVMSMYSRCGEFEDAIKVFDEMPQRNEGEFFSKNGYPKMPFPHGWEGNAGLYAVGFIQRGFSSASSDAVKIAQDIGEVWNQETKQKKSSTLLLVTDVALPSFKDLT